MITNKFVRLLFDNRGTITRREYWASLVVVLICFLSTLYPILKSWLASTYFSNIDGHDFYISTMLQTVFEAAFSVVLPFTFIALYISLVATVKRCRALSIATSKGIVMGVFTYLIFSSFLALLYLMAYTQGIRDTSSFLGYMSIDLTFTLLVTLFTLFIIAGILTVVYISVQKADVDHKEEVSEGYDSIRSLHAIGKLMFAFLPVVLLGIIILDKVFDISMHLFDIDIWVYFGVVQLAYVIVYLYILVQRGKDAGVKPVVILSIIGAFVLLCAAITYLIYFASFSPIFIAIGNVITDLLFSARDVLFFVLLALPSKEQEIEDEQNLKAA